MTCHVVGCWYSIPTRVLITTLSLRQVHKTQLTALICFSAFLAKNPILSQINRVDIHIACFFKILGSLEELVSSGIQKSADVSREHRNVVSSGIQKSADVSSEHRLHFQAHRVSQSSNQQKQGTCNRYKSMRSHIVLSYHLQIIYSVQGFLPTF
jgi:hypothetical protein